MTKIQHIVLLKFKQETTDEKIAYLFGLLGRLQELFPGITHFSHGPNVSNEGLNEGYKHGFIMTFSSVAARDAYLPHPEHERMKAEIFPHIDGVLTFDIAANS
jgi:hypothetical protein